MGIEFESKLMAAAKIQEENMNQKQAEDSLELIKKDKNIESLKAEINKKDQEVIKLNNQVKEISTKLEGENKKVKELSKQLETDAKEKDKNKTNFKQLDEKLKEQVKIVASLQLLNVKLKEENDSWAEEKVIIFYCKKHVTLYIFILYKSNFYNTLTVKK